ncbi:MAG: cysteine hydrolase [Variovorax sp.]|nr:MAG: cysteine hydrolase [Variovorax sp.]
MSSQSSTVSTTRTAPGHTALLVIDMISCWDFPDAEKLLPPTLNIVGPVSRLMQRCRTAGVPVIFANDNRGGWRSDFRMLVEQSLACGGEVSRITAALRPQEEDYFLLKPQFSAFLGTPLQLLLANLEVRRIVLTGVAADQCVLTTASEARMHDLEVVVPRDGVATQTRARAKAAELIFTEALGLPMTPCSRIRFEKAP